MKKVKLIFAMLALVAVLFHSGAYTAVFLNFQFNQDYIARNHCVNRFSPELKCEGKCQLKKQLTHQEQQTQDGGLLSVQLSLDWVLETTVERTDMVLGNPIETPAEYFLTFITQHNATPWPQPPCLLLS